MLGPPQAPAWVGRELAQRGGSLTVAVAVEPKARHGRWEARLVWALHDPALNAYVGSSGEHGVAWPHLGQLVRVERWRTQVGRGRPVGDRQVEVDADDRWSTGLLVHDVVIPDLAYQRAGRGG